jgi:phage-related protein
VRAPFGFKIPSFIQIFTPVVKHLQGDLWEVRTQLANRIARVIFAVEGNTMYLLHGFIKTTPKTAPADLALAQKRWKQIKL